MAGLDEKCQVKVFGPGPLGQGSSMEHCSVLFCEESFASDVCISSLEDYLNNKRGRLKYWQNEVMEGRDGIGQCKGYQGLISRHEELLYRAKAERGEV